MTSNCDSVLQSNSLKYRYDHDQCGDSPSNGNDSFVLCTPDCATTLTSSLQPSPPQITSDQHRTNPHCVSDRVGPNPNPEACYLLKTHACQMKH